jgi:dTDP-4-dehydrorhamnose reductase
MLRLGAESENLGVIVDQIGTTTYAVDSAGCILTIIQRKSQAFGLYHSSNEGVTSWYNFAKVIFELAAYPVKVNALINIDTPNKSARPIFSVVDKSKLKNNFNIEIPCWRDSLALCISKIRRS